MVFYCRDYIDSRTKLCLLDSCAYRADAHCITLSMIPQYLPSSSMRLVSTRRVSVARVFLSHSAFPSAVPTEGNLRSSEDSAGLPTFGVNCCKSIPIDAQRRSYKQTISPTGIHLQVQIDTFISTSIFHLPIKFDVLQAQKTPNLPETPSFGRDAQA